jgi:ubiquinol-cytochrome c reductase cytochrome b subunit
MLLWHVVLLPVAVGVVAVLHLVLVRRHGVVPPLDAPEDSTSGTTEVTT